MAVTIDGSASVTTNDGVVLGITRGTAVASTSGTSIDFTGIPSWVKRITVMLSGVSTNGSSSPMIQLGTSGGVQTTSYIGSNWTSNTSNTALSAGFQLLASSGAGVTSESTGIFSLFNSATGLWSASINTGRSDAATIGVVAGSKTLSGTLDRVRITTVNGTDIFDAGSINILYEG
jgi:hypothetical protein